MRCRSEWTRNSEQGRRETDTSRQITLYTHQYFLTYRMHHFTTVNIHMCETVWNADRSPLLPATEKALLLQPVCHRPLTHLQWEGLVFLNLDQQQWPPVVSGHGHCLVVAVSGGQWIVREQLLTSYRLNYAWKLLTEFHKERGRPGISLPS